MKFLVSIGLLAFTGCATLGTGKVHSGYIVCLIAPPTGQPYYDACANHVRPIDPNEEILMIMRPELDLPVYGSWEESRGTQ